jgi:glycosyltransferase involved in cell wall biosynthesis
MKKVLIITYYWPPSGGGGVQRWLKFVKYLPIYGWHPIVVVPKDPEYPVIDNSLYSDIPQETKIIKLPIWEPYDIFKKITGRKKGEKVNTGLLFDDKKRTLVEKISLWIRGNILIPDPRIFWVKPSAKRLIEIIPGLKPDIIVTTGPPHSIHLIGQKIKTKFPEIPWLIDLRDPWANFDMLDQFYLSGMAKKLQKNKEYTALKKADIVTTVSPSWAQEFGKSVSKKVHCITNGFDEDDFKNFNFESDNKNFTVSHIGIINSYRNPEPLWSSFQELCEELPDFRKRLNIRITGITDAGLGKILDKYPLVKEKTTITGYIPHENIIEQYQDSSCLLLLLNNTKNSNGHIPGKFFEYIASGKPVLAIAPQESDVAKIIKEYDLGYACPFDEKETIKQEILSIFNNEIHRLESKVIDSFSRRKLTEKLSYLMSETIKKSRKT